MITALSDDTWVVALSQAVAAVLLVLAVLLVAQRYGVSMFGEATWAMTRGFVQVVAVGSVLAIGEYRIRVVTVGETSIAIEWAKLEE